MKKVLGSFWVSSAILFLLTIFLAAAPVKAADPTVADEKASHPRIAAAIESLEVALAELKEAPHNFGGHKAEAIRACEKAIHELHKALAYRAKEDAKKKK